VLPLELRRETEAIPIISIRFERDQQGHTDSQVQESIEGPSSKLQSRMKRRVRRFS